MFNFKVEAVEASKSSVTVMPLVRLEMGVAEQCETFICLP